MSTSLLVGALLALISFQAHAFEIHHEFLPHPDDPKKKVELYWAAPETPGAHPAILYIHGHQDPPNSVGGRQWVDNGSFERNIPRGYVVAAVSQPGYGQSDGPPDYCGPFTWHATQAALAFLRKLPVVNPAKVALFGHSRGSVVAAMVATQDPKLAAVVLSGGLYDIADSYARWRNPKIKANVEREMGTTPEAFRSRSALFFADRIKMPILIAHGESDDRAFVDQARAFADRISRSGGQVTLKTFPGAGHIIPAPQLYAVVVPFLAAHLVK